MGPADPYTATSTTTTSTTNGSNAPIPVAENSQSNNASGAPAPAKWLQPKNESEMETDKVGLVAHNRGYKHILFIVYSFVYKRFLSIGSFVLCCLQSLTFAMCVFTE